MQLTYEEYDAGVASLGQEALEIVRQLSKDLTLGELVALQADARELQAATTHWAQNHPDGAKASVIRAALNVKLHDRL